MMSKRGQLTMFIILAIVIVSVISLFFMFRGMIGIEKIPPNIEPIYNTFLTCIEENTEIGINALESQGGYIYLPDFEAGSGYMPFSSQLSFLGNPIPYWYYVSGNNIQKEQIPSKTEMEEQLSQFIEENIRSCIFDNYYEQGFEISLGEPKAETKIKEKEVIINLDMKLNVNKENDTAILNNHQINVKSRLGMLYDNAKTIYQEEQERLFLEDYSIDTLRNYAPVDGVELTCSPKVWSADEIFDELQEAIEINTLALKVKGGDFTLTKRENEYFVLDIPIDNEVEVRFLNSKEWPYAMEVNPSEESILMAKPVGNQPGLGILGFCYTTYHFIYDIKYPVLIQVQSGDEIFQFPMAVVILGNQPRKPLETNSVNVESPELCSYQNTPMEVYVFDTNFNPIKAEISYECFGEKCDLGKTSEEGYLEAMFPQCVNGYVIARAEGYEDARTLYSVTESGTIDIIMNKLYEKEIRLMLDGNEYEKSAILNFISEKEGSKTVVYPEQKTVELTEGQYEIQAHIYKESEIKLQETTKRQCMDIPQSGLGGLFGLTKEKCFDIKIPSQTISNALSGGGKENYYILESELQESDILEIGAQGLPTPKKIEELQQNYDLFEEKGLDIYFK